MRGRPQGPAAWAWKSFGTWCRGGKLEWEDGTICDPKNGKIYDCEMWLEEDNMDELKVRGYIYFCSARRPGCASKKRIGATRKSAA